MNSMKEEIIKWFEIAEIQCTFVEAINPGTEDHTIMIDNYPNQIMIRLCAGCNNHAQIVIDNDGRDMCTKHTKDTRYLMFMFSVLFLDFCKPEKQIEDNLNVYMGFWLTSIEEEDDKPDLKQSIIDSISLN